MQETDLILALLALVSGGVGAWLVASNGHRFALIDSPNERSSHSEPTPKGGGIGLLAAFIIASLWLEVQPGFWISIAILALLSLFVDRFHRRSTTGLPPGEPPGPAVPPGLPDFGSARIPSETAADSPGPAAGTNGPG